MNGVVDKQSIELGLFSQLRFCERLTLIGKAFDFNDELSVFSGVKNQ